MAEIKIEKKKPIWPWILALLVIAAIVVFYFMNNDDYDDDMEADDIEEIDEIDDADVGYLQLNNENGVIIYYEEALC
ncbi:MAG: hypothetical protein R3213_02615 [Flavobacteriaceae bacterium]|nr:hypothetical protein [Flavobacteriaceae bacterium]